MNQAGHTVFAITPTASAAQVLRNEGFAQATRVEDFLRNGENRDGLSRAVVICDGARLKSNRSGDEVASVSTKARHARPLVGDVRSIFPWKPVTFCGCSKPIVSFGAVESGKFVGRFRLNIASRSRRW